MSYNNFRRKPNMNSEILRLPASQKQDYYLTYKPDKTVYTRYDDLSLEDFELIINTPNLLGSDGLDATNGTQPIYLYFISQEFLAHQKVQDPKAYEMRAIASTLQVIRKSDQRAVCIPIVVTIPAKAATAIRVAIQKK